MDTNQLEHELHEESRNVWINTRWNFLKAMQDGKGKLTDLIIPGTYEELKTARDEGKLIPGAFYRMTDYETIITGSYDLTSQNLTGKLHCAVSAGHQFDLLLCAEAVNSFDEDVRVLPHEGDTYFANSDLKSWELKYTIDNDASYSWANAAGRGVIFWMKDEFGNQADYDFKNIQFVRYALKFISAPGSFTNDSSYLVAYDAEHQPNRYGAPYHVLKALKAGNGSTYTTPFAGNKFTFDVGADILDTVQSEAIDATFLSTFHADLYYTFDYFDVSTGKHLDVSLSRIDSMPCYNNIVAVNYRTAGTDLGSSSFSYLKAFGPSGNVWEFNSRNNAGLYKMAYGVFECRLAGFCSGNTFGGNCASIKFSEDCHGNIFGNDSSYNDIGFSSYENIAGDNFARNKCDNLMYQNCFAESCYDNVFYRIIYNNKIGSAFQNNNILDIFTGNTIGNNFQCNILGRTVTSNTFGNNFKNNQLVGTASSNTFGNGCQDNFIGRQAGGNTIGDNFSNNRIAGTFNGNSIGTGCSKNIFGFNISGFNWGNNCTNNILGSSISGIIATSGGLANNVFGSSISSLTFRTSNCSNNSFGSGISSCTFQSLQFCEFGNYISGIQFANNCDCTYSTFGTGISVLNVNCTVISLRVGNNCNGNTINSSNSTLSKFIICDRVSNITIPAEQLSETSGFYQMDKFDSSPNHATLSHYTAPATCTSVSTEDGGTTWE